MRLIVTGASGLLGPYLMEAAGALGEVAGVARRDTDVVVDLADASLVTRHLDEMRPDVVIHAAAWTDIERCEQDPEGAERANVLPAANLAEAMPEETRLVFLSTDQVYADEPGLKREGIAELPVNEYGRSKLRGERAACRHKNTVVLRCNLFGPSRTPGRSSLSDWVVKNLAENKEIGLFTDSFFSPLHMETLAAAVCHMAIAEVRGTYNLGCRNGRSKRDFAYLVASHLGLPFTSARDARASDIPDRAPRPKDLRMDVSRIEAILGRPMPSLEEEIAKL